MLKRILKIVGISLALILGAGALSVGIYALQGGFADEKIKISKLYFENEENDTSVIRKTIYTLEDITTLIKYEPLNATDKTLQVTIDDQVGVLAKKPDKLIAGEPFELKINKDKYGNNVGGVVYMTIRQGIAEVKLTVLVDVVIPNNVIFFSGNTKDKVTTTGKHFTMGISQQEQSVYLKSTLVNAFSLMSGDQNLKSAQISYDYYDLAGVKKEPTKVIDNIVADRAEDDSYYYKIPITPKWSGSIHITAKMHRTYEIEKDYIDGGFDALETMPYGNDHEKNLYDVKLQNYNAFINKYINYFDTTNESYNFFKTTLKNGQVDLKRAEVADSKKFVFVSCSANIAVSAVNLENITSIAEPKSFKVFDTINYALENNISGLTTRKITTEFDLVLSVDNESVSNIDAEKSNLFGSLEVSPYLYISRLDEDGMEVSLESIELMFPNAEILDVYGIVGNKPVLTKPQEGLVVGYLVKLTKDNEYIKINEKTSASGIKYWETNFNVPLGVDRSPFESPVYALFLEFKVSGINLTTDETIVERDFTRVYIEYDKYEFVNENISKLAFGNLKPKMAINTSLEDSSNNYALGKQPITIDTSGIKNFGTVQYKRVIYFVEKSSNQIEGEGQKIVAVGNYGFKNMSGDSIGFGTDALVGQRIPTYQMNQGQMEYYIQTINASLDPIKVFAVVYLCDRLGRPIDIHGNQIVVDETTSSEMHFIVAVSISEVDPTSITKITIDSFVDNINFYTINASDHVINDYTSYKLSFNKDQYQKRNNIRTFKLDELTFEGDYLVNLQNFLQLKLLKSFDFKLFATNFELNETGGIADVNKIDGYAITYKDFNGNTIEAKYNINVISNKQIALNKMCSAVDFSNNYYLVTKSDDIEVTSVIHRQDSDVSTSNAILIEFNIIANNLDSLTEIFYISNKDTINQPYSNLLTSDTALNRVTYIVNLLEIDDITLEDVQYNELYAQYASGAYDGSLTFKTSKYESGTTTFEEYVLELINSGDIAHSIKTNLTSIDGSVINNNLVDPSQSVYQLPTGVESSARYPDLKSYIDFYTTGNNIDISYTNPQRLMVLEQDLEFTNYNGDNYLYVGSKTYFVDTLWQGKDEITLTIMDKPYIVKVSGEKLTLTLPKDSYFPVKFNQNVAIILGAEFEIKPFDEGKFMINDSEVNGFTFEVKFATQDQSEYLETRNFSVLTANSGKTLGKVNFVQGEADGKIVYMVVTFSIMPTGETNQYHKIVTKIFEYKLLQSEIDIYCVNKVIASVPEYNSDTVPFNIESGKTTAINFNSTNEPPYIIISASDEQSFFNHVKFRIVGVDSGLQFVYENDSLAGINYSYQSEGAGFYRLRIYAPNAYQAKNERIEMTYKYKGETITQYFYLNIQPNVEFERKTGTGINVDIDGNYYIDVDANSQLLGNAIQSGNNVETSGSIDSILATFFDMDNIDKVILTTVNGHAFYNIDSGIFKTLESYGIWDGTKTIRDQIEFGITLVLTDDSELTLTKKFIIKINPIYTVDYSQLLDIDNAHYILNGSTIFDTDNGIKLYIGTNPNSVEHDINKYLAMFSLTLKIGDTDIDVLDGQNVLFENTPLENTKYTLTLITKYPTTNHEKSISIVLGIRGVEGYFSQKGEFETDYPYPSDPSELTKLDENKTISATSGATIELDKYIALFTAIQSEFIDIHLYAVVKVGENYVNAFEATENGSYEIYYATKSDGVYSVKASTGYMLSINIL